MLITIKNIKSAGKRKYIYYLTSCGKIPTYVNEETGLKQYNTKDLKTYKQYNKRGRPLKQEYLEDEEIGNE